MTGSLQDLLNDCVVVIDAPHPGTGFFVGPDLIATCTHCVSANPAEIQVRWHGQPVPVRAVTTHGDPDDVALLTVDVAGAGDHPCVLLGEAAPTLGDSCYCYGYPPGKTIGAPDDTTRAGTPALATYSGSVDSPPAAPGQGRPLLLLQFAWILPGMSGSPVLDLRTGDVCGMITTTLDAHAPYGGHATPSTILVACFPTLAPAARTFHDRDHRWASTVARAPQSRAMFARLFAEHARFAGRDAAIREITAFCTGAGGYLILDAPSGYGKTALMVELATRTLSGACAHFFSRDHLLTDVDSFLHTVVEQLAAHHRVPPPSSDDPPFEWRRQLATLLTRDATAERPLRLLIDAVDEAEFDLGPYLPPLGAHVHVVLSARTMADHDWHRLLIPPRQSAARITLGQFTERDVESLVAGVETLPNTQVERVAHALLAVTNGDPFYASLLVQDLWADSAGTMQALTATAPAMSSKGLAAYLDRWWAAAISSAGQDRLAAFQLIAYLAAAEAPLSRSDAIAISATDALDASTIDRAVATLGRFLLGDAVAGYRLCHDRFRSHAREKLGELELAAVEERLVQYCAAWRGRSSNVFAFAAYARQLAAKSLRLRDPAPYVEALRDGAFLAAKARAARRRSAMLDDIETGFRLLANLTQDDVAAAERHWPTVLWLTLAEDRIGAAIVSDATSGTIINLALKGDVDSALREAWAIPSPSEQMLQLCLVAESLARRGTESDVDNADRVLRETIQRLGSRRILFTYDVELQLIDFAVSMPGNAGRSARVLVENLIGQSVRSQLELVSFWMLVDRSTYQTTGRESAGFLDTASEAMAYSSRSVTAWDESDSRPGPLGGFARADADTEVALKQFTTLQPDTAGWIASCAALRERWRAYCKRKRMEQDSAFTAYPSLRRRVLDEGQSDSPSAGSDAVEWSQMAIDRLRLRIVSRVAHSDAERALTIAQSIRNETLRGVALGLALGGLRRQGASAESLRPIAADALRLLERPHLVAADPGVDNLAAALAGIGLLGTPSWQTVIRRHIDSQSSLSHVTAVRAYFESDRTLPVRDGFLAFEIDEAKSFNHFYRGTNPEEGWDILTELARGLGSDVTGTVREMIAEAQRAYGSGNEDVQQLLLDNRNVLSCALTLIPRLPADDLSMFENILPFLRNPWRRRAIAATIAQRSRDLALDRGSTLLDEAFSFKAVEMLSDFERRTVEVLTVIRAARVLVPDRWPSWYTALRSIAQLALTSRDLSWDIRHTLALIMMSEAAGDGVACDEQVALLIDRLRKWDERASDYGDEAKWAGWLATCRDPQAITAMLALVRGARASRRALSQYDPGPRETEAVVGHAIDLCLGTGAPDVAARATELHQLMDMFPG